MLVRSRPNNMPFPGRSYLVVNDAETNIQVRLMPNRQDPSYLLDLTDKINEISAKNNGYVELKGRIDLQTQQFDDPRSKEHFRAFDLIALEPDPAKVAEMEAAEDEIRRINARAAAQRQAQAGPRIINTAEIRARVSATEAREASQAQQASAGKSDELPV